MPALTAADVTVTVNKRDRLDTVKQHQATIAFGDGALTYPSVGIPVTIDQMGLSRVIDSIQFMETDGNGFRYEYDRSAKTIRIMRQNIRTGSTAAAAAESGALVEDSDNAELADFRVPKTTIDTDFDIGPGAEALTTHAPQATSLEAVVQGF